MSLVPDFADDHRAATAASMSQQSNGHVPINTRSTHNINEELFGLSNLLDARRWAAMAVALFFCWMNVIVVPVACLCTLFIFLYPLKLFSMNLFNRLEHELCRLVNDEWMSAAKYCGLNVVEYGDDINRIANDRVLCLVNHLGLIDHFCLMTSFHNKRDLASKYMWVIFNIWKWNPVGAMWTAHGNFFVQGSGIGAMKRAQLLNRFKRHLRRNYWQYDYGWIVMYPEGSRKFLIEKAELHFCEKHRILPFHHTTHPRLGAAHAVLEICGPKPQDNGSLQKKENFQLGKVQYIVDCTLAYHKGIVPHFGCCLLGLWPTDKSMTVAIHYKIHPVRQEWCSNQELFKKWLYEQYRQKDELLAHFYKTGEILSQPDNKKSNLLNGRSINVSDLRCLMVNFVWLALFYFHYNMWLRPCLRIICALFAKI